MVIRQRPVDCRIDRPPADKIIIGIQFIIPWCDRKHPVTIVNCHAHKKHQKNMEFLILSRPFHLLFHTFKPFRCANIMLFKHTCYYLILSASRSPICLQPTRSHPSDIISAVRYPSCSTDFTALSIASASRSRSKL